MNEGELTELHAAVAHGEPEQLAARVAAAIRPVGGYRWVGLYDIDPNETAVVGWDGPGPPGHPRFARTEGLCGAAAARETVIVDDVDTDPRYLTTHATTRSEIVAPILAGDLVVGLIDVESDRPHAFGERDKDLLEQCAAVIAPMWPPRRVRVLQR